MVIWVGAIVVVAAWGGGLAWVANAAAERGYSQVLWTIAAVAISALCVAVTWLLPLDAMGVAGGVAALLVPLMLIFIALAALIRGLNRLPVKVRESRTWPVVCRTNGSGQLEITDELVRLTWQDRTQDIPRHDVRSARQDGECLRLAWSDGELVLLPMAAPQTRDGRIQQSQTLARLLIAPSLPTAIQVHRR